MVTVGADTSGVVGVVYVVIVVVGSVVVSEHPGTVLDTEGAFGSAVGTFHTFEVVGVHDSSRSCTVLPNSQVMQ